MSPDILRMQGEHGAVYAEREFMCPLCRSLANTLVPLSPLTAAGVEGRAPATPATPATPAMPATPATGNTRAARTSAPAGSSMIKLAAFGPGWVAGGARGAGGAEAAVEQGASDGGQLSALRARLYSGEMSVKGLKVCIYVHALRYIYT